VQGTTSWANEELARPFFFFFFRSRSRTHHAVAQESYHRDPLHQGAPFRIFRKISIEKQMRGNDLDDKNGLLLISPLMLMMF
jgi:hypothetical protein